MLSNIHSSHLEVILDESTIELSGNIDVSQQAPGTRPGHDLKGKVILTLHKSLLTAVELKVCFAGHVYIHFSPSNSSFFHHQPEYPPAARPLVERSVTLWSPQSETAELRAGIHEWDFNISVPANLPPTSATRSAKIQYIVQALLVERKLPASHGPAATPPSNPQPIPVKPHLVETQATKVVTIQTCWPRGGLHAEQLICDSTRGILEAKVHMAPEAFVVDPVYKFSVSLNILKPTVVKEVKSIKCQLREKQTYLCKQANSEETTKQREELGIGIATVTSVDKQSALVSNRGTPSSQSSQSGSGGANTLSSSIAGASAPASSFCSPIHLEVSLQGAHIDVSLPEFRVVHRLYILVQFETGGDKLDEVIVFVPIRVVNPSRWSGYAPAPVPSLLPINTNVSGSYSDTSTLGRSKRSVSLPQSPDYTKSTPTGAKFQELSLGSVGVASSAVGAQSQGRSTLIHNKRRNVSDPNAGLSPPLLAQTFHTVSHDLYVSPKPAPIPERKSMDPGYSSREAYANKEKSGGWFGLKRSLSLKSNKASGQNFAGAAPSPAPPSSIRNPPPPLNPALLHSGLMETGLALGGGGTASAGSHNSHSSHSNHYGIGFASAPRPKAPPIQPSLSSEVKPDLAAGKGGWIKNLADARVMITNFGRKSMDENHRGNGAGPGASAAFPPRKSMDESRVETTKRFGRPSNLDDADDDDNDDGVKWAEQRKEIELEYSQLQTLNRVREAAVRAEKDRNEVFQPGHSAPPVPLRNLKAYGMSVAAQGSQATAFANKRESDLLFESDDDNEGRRWTFIDGAYVFIETRAGAGSRASAADENGRGTPSTLDESRSSKRWTLVDGEYVAKERVPLAMDEENPDNGEWVLDGDVYVMVPS
ncbi:uncharacterized protein BJ171DRAFT_577795 [Polychytrium aggregatum]|uniref:uncharacterized protein n=1 Tax=Polychytrium aggregatum TaxID=110093 RepID=UPI0022FE2B66|nr:uncharacterized protein BJ171DRAFT_577795 [Polychytrium aggregatum]KAI9208703.1 hypothetical protein BJ171DRAFT_577795 [Polychytrium aggregatum]